jgi:hypothetical protein
MRSFAGFILLIIIFLATHLDTAAQGLKGHISNEKGEPLSYATIYISEARMGTATNLNGEYELSLASGTYTVTFQHLGYTPVSQQIYIGNNVVEKNIVLSEQIFQMPEVVIHASEKDRAVYIMRKAIGMAPYHLNQVKQYKAEVYIKGGWGINKMPKMLQRQMNAKANDKEIKEGEYYFSESVNLITFNAPDKYIHEVVSSRTNMPFNEAGSSPMDFIQASFYQPVLVDMAISPLAPNAFSHYTFRFMGATRQGDFIINKIQVIPNRESQQLFSGFIYIVEDEWTIQSLDLSNNNMAGTVKLKELYMPVEKGLWMPVNYEFNMDISFIGIKAAANYSSSVKYLDVEPDKNLPVPSGLIASSVAGIQDSSKDKTMKEIENILAKDKLSSADMVRLSKLNEKSTKPKGKEPLEVVEKTTYLIDPNATKKDSTYWDTIRPIPLTDVERLSVVRDSVKDSLSKGSNMLVLSLGKKEKEKTKDKAMQHKGVDFTKAMLKGKQWKIDDNNSLNFNGLISLKTFSFNTVDGFTAGTGLTWLCKTGEYSKLSVNPVFRYAFNRKDLMWSVNSGYDFNSMKHSALGLRFGSTSTDFSSSGVSPLLNTISSLLFRYNYKKLYESSFAGMSFTSEISNGLRLKMFANWEKRSVLENTTDFSIFRPHRDYTLNLPPNPFVEGSVHGYNAMIPVNHNNLSFTTELFYTPRQRYRISNKSKINLDADYPTFHLLWKHGYNYNDTLSGNYDLLRGDLSMHSNLGAMRQLRWSIGGGGFFNRQSLQIQDMYMFNTQKSMILLNNYEDVYYLKSNYAISSPSQFAEAHIRYTTPCLLLKRLPLISSTLIRENLSASWLWTPDYGNYYETGYSLSEIYLFGEAGFFAGFHNLSFDSVGFRFIFILN